jgi:hypothetical protein
MQSKHSNDKIFAVAQRVEDVADCYFYHTVELPGYGSSTEIGICAVESTITWGRWRLQVNASWKLGPPAVLSRSRWKRCGEVVSIEVATEHGWDFLPYPAKRLEEVFGPVESRCNS